MSLSGRSGDFRWTRTAPAASSQALAPATACAGAGLGAGADVGAGAGAPRGTTFGTIRANPIRCYDSDAWDDCSVKLELESEAWADCDEKFQDSLSFKKGDCLLRLAHEDEDDLWCWGKLKGTSKQGWVPRGLFSIRNRNAHQAAENRLAALAWR